MSFNASFLSFFSQPGLRFKGLALQLQVVHGGTKASDNLRAGIAIKIVIKMQDNNKVSK